MGKPQSKSIDSTSLLPNEIHDFQSITSFSDEILIKLHNHYKRFSSLQTDDGVIDYAEFSEILRKDNNMSKRIFNAVDINKDGVINFREFIKYISCFVNGTFEEKTNLSFKLFADHKTKLISKDQMKQLILDVLEVEESKFVKNFFTKKDIEVLVNKTFEDVNKVLDDQIEKEKARITSNLIREPSNISMNKDCIDMKGYKLFIEKNPQILDWLIVDLERIKMPKDLVGKNNNKKVSCFGCSS